MRIPDPQLDYHADRYIAQRISAHGVTFERYLTDPAHYDTLALQPEPLLPAQRTVAEAWARQTDPAARPRPRLRTLQWRPPMPPISCDD